MVLICKTFSLLHSRMLCAKFSLLEKKVLYFRYFIIISSLKKGMVLDLNKLEFPLPKDVLCYSFILVDTGTVVLEKMIFKFSQGIFPIS